MLDNPLIWSFKVDFTLYLCGFKIYCKINQVINSVAIIVFKHFYMKI